MENKDFFEVNCPECKEKNFAARKQEFWYCGYCGKKINLSDADKKKTEIVAETTEITEKTPEKKVAVVKKVDNQGDTLRAFASKSKKVKVKDKRHDLREKPSFAKPAENEPTPAKQEIKTDEKPVEIPKAEPIKEVSKPEPVKEVPKPEPIKEVPKPEPVKEIPKAEPVKEVPKPEPVKEIPKPESVKEVPKPEPVKEVPKAEPVKEVPKAEPIKEIPKPEPVKEVSKPEPVKEIPKPEPVKETPKPEPAEEKPKYELPEFQIYLNALKKYNGNSQTVIIPNGVTTIENEAFKDNKTIQKVSIPNSVIAIGTNVFEGCSSLLEVSLPNGLKKIGYMTFSGCNSLESITIPASVDEIMFNAMYCDGLKEITFKSADTRWETDSTNTNPSFMVDMNESGKGVNKIIYDTGDETKPKREYEAKEVFKSKTIRNYFKSKELCPNCGGTFGGLFAKKCKDCGTKKGE